MSTYLTKEQELEMGTLIQAGIRAQKKLKKINREEVSHSQIIKLESEIEKGAKAEEVLVSNNVRLVYDLANKFKRHYRDKAEIEDIIGDGMVGLWTAVQKYDPKRGNKFSTMAYSWINQAIIRGSHKTSRIVRLPENRINEHIRINQLRREYDRDDLTSREIDEKVRIKMKLTSQEFADINNAAGNHTSLNKFVGNESDGVELQDFLSDASPSAEMASINENMYEALYEAIYSLDEVSQAVLYAACKMSPKGGKPKTAKLLKEEMGITATEYKKIFEAAVSHIKKSLEEHGIEKEDFE